MQLAVVATVPAPLSTEVALDRNPAAVYLGRLGAGSRRAMAQKLGRAASLLAGEDFDAESFPWALVRYQHVGRLREALLEEGAAAATVNTILAAVRGVLREAWLLGEMTVEDYRRACEVDRVEAKPLPTGRDVSPAEVRALVAACEADATPAGARDAAMLAMLAVGMRRAEIVGCDLADLDLETGALRIIASKGGKSRIVYLAGAALDAVLDWLQVRGEEPGALLLPVDKWNRVGTRRLTTQAIYNALRDRQVEAGVAPMTPHDFRRTAAGSMLDAGVDIATVAAFLGHASVTTTQRYDRRGERAKAAAAGQILFPYSRRRS